MSEAEDFLGVPAGAVMALGKIAVVSGRLDVLASEILEDLGGSPGKAPTSEILKEVQKKAAGGLPSHATVEVPVLVDWAERVRTALDERNLQLHSERIAERSKDAWIPKQVHHRSGTERYTNEVELNEFVDTFSKLYTEGTHLHFGLSDRRR